MDIFADWCQAYVKNLAIMSELLVMAYLKNAAVIRHCKASKVKNRHAVYRAGLFGTFPYLGALARYLPGHRGRVPTTSCAWSSDVPNGADCPHASLF